LNAVEEIGKMSLWCNLGFKKKQHAILRNYKAHIHEMKPGSYG